MSPCIKLYNDKCLGDENSTIIRKRFFDEMNLDNFLCYDARILTNITLLIQRVVNSGAPLIAINDHHEIIDDLNISDIEKIDLVNIDFHHDIWYSSTSLSNIDSFDTYTCADWVGYLIRKNHINTYTWYKMPNSDVFTDNLDVEFNVKTSREIADIDDRFDAVYLCLSPQWVPYKYHHLYDLIVELFGGRRI